MADRIKELRVSIPLILSLAMQGAEIRARCVEGLPDGSTVRSVRYSPLNDGIVIVVVEHESFEGVAEGADIPSAVVRFERLEP